APEAAGPWPGILIVHGAEGPGAGWSHRFAAILAAHGFAALPMSYGEGTVFGSGSIREVPLSSLGTALGALAALDTVGKCGVFGWSKGAEMTLLWAALDGRGADALAVHAPADHVGAAFDPRTFDPSRRLGRPAPDAPPAWTWPSAPDKVLPGAPIEVERISAPLFLSVGLSDEILDPAMTRRLAERLGAAGRPPTLWEAPGQGHAFDFEMEPVLWQRLTTFFAAHLG
ncbi:MAG: alpha/beta hydrolase, partial [Pseudomonadota bacterium]